MSRNRYTTRTKALSLLLAITLLFLCIPSHSLKAASVDRLISANKPTSASSSESGHPASMAVDADATNNSFWSADLSSYNNAWWQIDLQGTYNLSKIIIRNFADGTRFYHYYIRGSLDGVHWTPIVAKSNNNVATDAGDVSHWAVSARYIRVNVTSDSANKSGHISDFKVYGSPIVMPSVPSVQVKTAWTDKGAYSVGNPVHFSYNLYNASIATDASILKVKAKIIGLTNPLFFKVITVNEVTKPIHLMPQQTYKGTADLWSIPKGTPTGAYAIYLEYQLSDGTQWEDYQTFFRITNASQLTSYTIDKQAYKGLSIFNLNGGMSAEYAVEKAGEALSAGVSQSWDVQGPGLGPNPVYSTPQFLQNSVENTVQFYNTNFGAATSYDTVIISTGVASVPYLSRAMKAPVLPLQFLASVNTVKELQSILDYSNEHDLPSYSTLGYDQSMPTGVAWLKLLDMPQVYTDFLTQHHVKNVVIMGSNGTTGGETTAKKLMETGTSTKGTNPGDIFVIYTQNGNATDLDHLTRKINDINEVPLESAYRNISDWESGVIQDQIDRFSSSIKRLTKVTAIDFVTGKTYINLYDFATYASLEFMKKNETYLAKDGDDPVRGITLNPYLMSHPFYETKIHYVPFLFWQGDSVNQTVGTRVNQTLRTAIAAYYPKTNFNNLRFWVNVSNNFGGFVATSLKNQLQANGMKNVHLPNYSKDELWNPADGMTASNELAAKNMIQFSSAAELKAWDDHLQPISMANLESIPAKYSGISVTRQ